MKIAICEDEKVYADLLKSKISLLAEKINEICDIDLFYDGDSLMKDYYKGYDAIFLDIKLSNANGYEIAKEIRKRDKDIVIIFITAYVEYATEGYKVNAFRYILKENIDIDLPEVLKSLIDLKTVNNYQNGSVIVNSNRKKETIYFKDIIYLTSNLRKIIARTSKGDIEFYGKLSEFIKELPEEIFVRTHNGFVINLEYVVDCKGNLVTLCDNNQIPISRSNHASAIKKIVNYMKRGVNLNACNNGNISNNL